MSKLVVPFTSTNEELFNLTDELIQKISRNWNDPHRKQGLRILSVLKNNLNNYAKLLKQAHPLAERWTLFPLLKVTFSFKDCNIKKGDISALLSWIDDLTLSLSRETCILRFQACYCNYTKECETVEFQIRLFF